MPIVHAVRWAVAVLLGVPSLLLILGNWAAVAGAAVDAFRGKTGRGFSFGLPWVAGAAGAAACVACPVERIRHLAWCPVLLDPSYSLPVLALALGLFSRPRGPSPPDLPPPEG